MKVLSWPQVLRGVVLDVDGTLYAEREVYTEHQRRTEMEAVAEHFGEGLRRAKNRIDNQTAELQKQLGRAPSAGEVIRALGLSQSWLTQVRSCGWHPERFLQADSSLPTRMAKLAKNYRVALVSTSPRQVVYRILEALDLHGVVGKLTVVGAEDAAPKPDPDPYCKAAQLLELEPQECLSIGDRLDFDCLPAQKIGMGAVYLENFGDLATILDTLTKVSLLTVCA